MTSRLDKLYNILFFIALGLFSLFALGSIAIGANDKAICLEHGWASSQTTWKLVSYCIREENAYEITRPLSEIIDGN